MFKVLLFAACVLLVKGQYGYPQYYSDGQPNPYQFSYGSPSDGGSSSHQESGDGQGRVQGSYTVTGEDGRSRTVEYVADENGFRPNIITNEPGTSNLAPADVTISSSADEGAVAYSQEPAAGRYAPSPIQYAPAPVQYAPATNQYAPSRNQYAPTRYQYAPSRNQYAPSRYQYAPAPYQYAPGSYQYAPARNQYAPGPVYGNSIYGGGPQYRPYRY